MRHLHLWLTEDISGKEKDRAYKPSSSCLKDCTEAHLALKSIKEEKILENDPLPSHRLDELVCCWWKLAHIIFSINCDVFRSWALWLFAWEERNMRTHNTVSLKILFELYDVGPDMTCWPDPIRSLPSVPFFYWDKGKSASTWLPDTSLNGLCE